MAPPSPRRSSRARATTSQSQNSSGSSVTSGRADRNTRNVYKTPSGKSTPSASLSSEPPEDLDDTLLGRRRKRGQDDEDKASRPETVDMNNVSDDLEEEDEAVRCICGADEYPGKPPLEGPDAEFFGNVDFTEDVTGFFVQCDICKVWQHGACVGIFSAESSPDEYFCEQCRKDLHKIQLASNKQKYSKYAPLYHPTRSNSRATSIPEDGARSPKPGSKNLRPGSSQAGKRRSTMNSRDAAYDDEQLRRAIEASREDNVQDTIEAVTRRTKRGRSDSEEILSGIKRQRTDSESESPVPEPPEEPLDQPSEDEAQARNLVKKARSSRHQPPPQPPTTRSDKEDKERQRLEAAKSRKGRAERRRADEPDPSEELPLATTNTQIKTIEEPAPVEETTPVPQPTPGTPPTSHPVVSSTQKRVARSHHKKSKGKNQYTKDRDGEKEESPARSMSRDIQKNADEHTASSTPKIVPTDHKHSHTKSKTVVPNKMSMLDMKRRVAAIMDFISRTQVDLAAEGSIASSSNSTSGNGSPQKASLAESNGDYPDHLGETEGSSDITEQEFKGLNCLEMMDVLTRDMVKWQNQYT